MSLSEIDITGYDTLLIDRDGVINRLLPNDYVKNWDEFEFMPYIFERFAEWNKRLKHIIVICAKKQPLFRKYYLSVSL